MVVYYVMALALWREAPLEEVLRVVCEGLQWLSGGKGGAVQASKSAISQARTRLGSEVLFELAQRVLRPLAPPAAPGAWYRGLRVMAVDGSRIKPPSSPTPQSAQDPLPRRAHRGQCRRRQTAHH